MVGMRCFCVCLSPAIDVTVALERMPANGEVVKDVFECVVPGGKGVNVARWLALRGAFVTCGGLLGADDAPLFRRELAKYGIADRFSIVDGPVRRNEMVVMPGYSYKLNRASYPGLAERLCFIEEDLKGVTVVLSGSLPAEFEAKHYVKVIEAVRHAGASRVVVDTSGEALRQVVLAQPDLLKVNAEECRDLTGVLPTSDAMFLQATERLRAYAREVIISDGARGCWFNGQFVAAARTKVLDTTGAGDMLLAEYCYSGNPSWAVEVGTAACMMPGGEPPREWLLTRQKAGEKGVAG